MTTRVLGLDDLKRKFKQLPVDVSKKVLRRMASAGSKVVKPVVIAGTPKRTGRAQRAVLIKFVREKSSHDQATYIVTYRQGKKQQQVKRGRGKSARLVNLDAYYIKWQERGWKARGGRRIAGRLFFAKALRVSSKRSLDAMVDTGHAEIKKVLP